jgi:hypothetical protein
MWFATAVGCAILTGCFAWAAVANIRHGRVRAAVALAFALCISAVISGVAAYGLAARGNPADWFPPSIPCSARGGCDR